MRVIAGSSRGLILSVPPKIVRPTPGRVKKALFDILGKQVIGARVIDLFAGSGSLGIEALSRGGEICCFVDRSDRCCRTIEKNLSKAKLMHRARIKRCDARRAIYELAKEGLRADLIFLDPPYDGHLILPVTAAIRKTGLLDGKGTVIIEHSAKFSPLPEGYCRLEQKRYGDSALTFITYG